VCLYTCERGFYCAVRIEYAGKAYVNMAFIKHARPGSAANCADYTRAVITVGSAQFLDGAGNCAGQMAVLGTMHINMTNAELRGAVCGVAGKKVYWRKGVRVRGRTGGFVVRSGKTVRVELRYKDATNPVAKFRKKSTPEC